MADWWDDLSRKTKNVAVDTFSKADPLSTGIITKVGQYYDAPNVAADAQAAAGQQAGTHVSQGYQQGLDTLRPMANRGMTDLRDYQEGVRTGQFQTDPSQFQTNPQFFQRGAQTGMPQQPNLGSGPAFQTMEPGRGQAFNSFQRGADPGFNQFQRGADPSFTAADQGNFEFDYQQSPGYQHAMKEGLAAIGGRASAQGRRFGAGADKEAMQFASGLAAQDYGNQFNRARGAFESDRAMGEREAGRRTSFDTGGYQFGTGVDVGQSNLANMARTGDYQFGTGVDVGQSNLANQQNLANYQFGQGQRERQYQGLNDRNLQNYQYGSNMGQRQYEYGANLGQNAYQFGVGADQNAINSANNANLAANNQNYNMYNQQNMNQANMMGGLATQGYNANVNLANMYTGQGDALANAALGQGNAQANQAMAQQQVWNNIGNNAMNLGAMYMGATG